MWYVAFAIQGHFRVIYDPLLSITQSSLSREIRNNLMFCTDFLGITLMSLSKKSIFFLGGGGHFGVIFVHFGACSSKCREPFNVYMKFCAFFFWKFSDISCHKWSWVHCNVRVTIFICKYVFLYANEFILMLYSFIFKVAIMSFIGD